MDQTQKNDEITRLTKKLAREMRAREAAETLLEQKSDQLFLEAAKAKSLAQAMESAADGIAITAPDGSFIYMNIAHAKMFGYEIDELIGKPWSVLYPKKSLKRFETEIMPVFSVKGNWNGETTGLHKDGNPVFQEITLTGLETGGLICATRDVSGKRRREFMLRELEQKLQSAEREAAVAVFSQTVAHDLNNLIAVISGYSGILMNQIHDDGVSRHIDRIHQASQQATNVIHALQSKTVDDKPEAGKEDLEYIISRSLDIAEGLCPDSIEIERDIEEKIVVETDELLLSRCLLNIMKNAFEAIPHKGRVAIKMRKGFFEKTHKFAQRHLLGYPNDNVMATIEITDNGVGMTSTELQQAFTVFHTTKLEAGKGLGMQSLKSLTDFDLAYIEVESQKNYGTCFRIYLTEAESSDLSIDIISISSDKPKILMVDDDHAVGEMMLTMLSDLGYEVEFHTSPREALDVLRLNNTDLIVSDFNMPDMDGEQFAHKVRAINPDIPIIIYSGQAVSIKKNPLFSAVLSKPVASEKIDSLIKSLTASSD